MTDLKECPYCGAPLAGVTGNLCPSCGSTLPGRSSSTPASLEASFQSSAEAMDEVKRMIDEGNPNSAAEVAGTAFGLSQEAARNTVEQTQIDMQHSGFETPPTEPEKVKDAPNSTPTIIDAPGYGTPQKPNNTRRNWLIGGAIGATLMARAARSAPTSA